MTMLHIEGRRWFQKTYGNTYHSVRIFKDGKEIAYLPYQYGYGEQYLQTALEWLQANGHAPKDAPYGWRTFQALGATYGVSDVGRKRDL
jgi:hypothetical protein